MKISVISPVYFGARSISELVSRVHDTFSETEYDYEVVLVDDGSPDNSWEEIEKASKSNPNVVGIKLSRNFGQHYAVTAGIEHASGDLFALIDCDLQDDPKDILRLLEEYKKGYLTVFTKRKGRKHGFFKKLGSKLYLLSFRIFSDSNFDIDVGGLILFDKQVRKEFLKIPDQDRLYVQIFKWIGLSSTTIDVEHHERKHGKSTYSISKMLRLAMQGWTFHSEKLLYLAIYFGFGMAFASLLGISVIIYLYFAQGFQSGWASTFTLILFAIGVIEISIGILGLYLGKIFKQVKNRPLYVVEKISGKNEE